VPNIGAGNVSKIRLAEQSGNPAAPAATFSILYLLASGVLRVRNAASTVYEFVTTAHDHSGTTNGPKLTQANSHESPDTDSAPTSLHHTTGTGANQAAAGGHGHAAPDASVVSYTPAVVTDWDADADPGDADNALDQLAERVDDLEGAVVSTVATDAIWDALGDTVYGTGADTATKLAGNTTTPRKFLRQVGAAGASAAPAWDTLAVGDYPDMVGANGGAGTKGAVPAPSAGDAAAGKYLKADGTWAAPASSGHTIQDEGTPLTARAALNFVGAGVVATDDSGNNRTVVTIAGGSGGASVLELQIFM
jgi:hypothetical protein